MNYFKQPFATPSPPWLLLGILFSMDLVVLIYYLLGPLLPANSGYPHPTFSIAVTGSILGPLLTGLLCLKGSFHFLGRSASHRRRRKTRRFSPLLWGINALIYSAGQIVWLIQILVWRKIPPYPSLTHYIQLGIYPCLIAAILLLPGNRLTRLTRLSVLLDSLTILAVIATLCYYFVLEPALLRGSGALPAKIVGGMYPALDLLVMLSLLVVALRAGESVLRPVLIFMGMVAILLFLSNVIHLYELLHQAYDEFSLARIAMLLSGLLDILSAQTVNAILQRDTATSSPTTPPEDELESMTTRWKKVLPATLVLIFGLLTFLLWLRGGQIYQGWTLIVGGFIVLLLIALRQCLTMYQISLLQSRLQRENRILDSLNTRLEKQAMTDPLTNVSNHQALTRKLAEMVAEAQTADENFSVIFIDIDHFKVINDTHGHIVGDQVLRHFASTVTTAVRTNDLVGRWGGEEFMVILPRTGERDAWQMAERIRAAVSQQRREGEDEPYITCSLGLASYPEDAEEAETLLKMADEAMYAAKYLGRNRIWSAYKAGEITTQAENARPPTQL